MHLLASTDIPLRLQALREEQRQILQALRFATWVQRQLLSRGDDSEGGRGITGGRGGERGEGGEDDGFGTCPVCLERCEERPCGCACPGRRVENRRRGRPLCKGQERTRAAECSRAAASAALLEPIR